MPVIRAFAGVPCIVNPTLAGPTKRKTDRLDARMLAWQDMCGLWRESIVPTDAQQAVKAHLLLRRNAGKQARASAARINNLLLRFGITLARHGSLVSGALRPVVEDRVPVLSFRPPMCSSF